MKKNIRNLILILLVIIVAIVPGYPALAETIGVIMTGDIQYYQEIHEVFLDEMSDVLHQEGIEIIVQKPGPNPMSWINTARKLVTIGSDFIVSYGMPGTLTTLKETSEIPVIFAGVYSPETMNLTGKNATGIGSTVSVEAVIKGLDELKKFDKLGVLFNKSEKDTIVQVKQIKRLEKKLGFKTVLFNVRNKMDIKKIKNIDALLITTSSTCVKDIDDIIVVARKERISTAALIGGCAEKGVVLTVTANPHEQGRELANIVKKVLGGAKTSEIPVKQPEQIEVIVNLREAKTLGIDIPVNVLSTATGLIE